MDSFRVEEINESSIVFSSVKDMEQAYHLLADGKDLILFKEEDGTREGEIFSGQNFSQIIDGKFKLLSREEL